VCVILKVHLPLHINKAKTVFTQPPLTSVYKWRDARIAFHLKESLKAFSQPSMRHVLMKISSL